MSRPGLALALAIGLAGSASVCAAAQNGQRTAPTPRESTAVEQIAPDRESVTVQQVGPASRSVPPTQASSPRIETTTQVTPFGDRMTQAPSSGSTRADGRPATSVAIGGSDRCDPKSRSAALTAVCANPIEARAGQFVRPTPTLSPEQRLAITRQAGDAEGTERELTRLSRGSGSGPLSTTEQGVAALTLQGAVSGSAAPVDETGTPAAVDPAVVDAIIQIIGQPAPPPR